MTSTSVIEPIASAAGSGDTVAHARVCRSLGLGIIKPDPKEKRPTYRGWTKQSLEPTDFTPDDQIGIMGGWISDGGKPGHALVIIDLDSNEAVKLADEYLPPTGMCEGRPGKPRSHRYYLVPTDSIPAWAVSHAPQAAPAAVAAGKHPGPFKKPLKHRDTGKVVIDFHGTGGQCVAPPSLHPSGERRVWQNPDGSPTPDGLPGELAVVSFVKLWTRTCDLAEACGAKIPKIDTEGGKNDDAADEGDRPEPTAEKPAGTTGVTKPRAKPAAPGGGPTVGEQIAAMWDADGFGTLGGKHFGLGEAERRCRLECRKRLDNELPRTGHGGHSSCLKLLRRMSNGYCLPRAVAEKVFEEEVNARLRRLAKERPKGEGYESYDDPAELGHKFDDAYDYAPPPEYPFGHLLTAERPVKPTVLTNAKFVKPTPAPRPEPAADAPAVVIEFTPPNKASVMTVKMKRGDVAVFADQGNPLAEKTRAKWAARLGVSNGQMLWLAEQVTSGAKLIFTPADLPADDPAAAACGPGEMVGRAVPDIVADVQLMSPEPVHNSPAVGLFTTRDGELKVIDEPEKLFAHVAGTAEAGGEHNVRWEVGAGLPTKSDLYLNLVASAKQFDDIYPLPHYPPVSRLFYLAPPPAAPGDGRALDALVSKFAVGSDTDRVILKAMFVTPFWGGRVGARPMFLVRGQDDDDKEGGCGAGKSTVAAKIGQLYGGSIDVDTGVKVADLKTRMLSDEARGLRLVQWDNLKTKKLSNSDLEALVTAKYVSGRSLYIGEGRRPNLFTYMLTMNGGSLSKDMAQRCVVLRVARPPAYQGDWDDDVDAFIATNRDALFADCRGAIERAAQLDWRGSSRWATWERNVLAGCVADRAGMEAVCEEIGKRRQADDANDADAEHLADAVRRYVLNLGGYPVYGVYAIPTDELVRIVRETLGGGARESKSETLADLARYRARIPELAKVRDAEGWKYFWVGCGHPQADELTNAARDRQPAKLRGAAAETPAEDEARRQAEKKRQAQGGDAGVLKAATALGLMQ